MIIYNKNIIYNHVTLLLASPDIPLLLSAVDPAAGDDLTAVDIPVVASVPDVAAANNAVDVVLSAIGIPIIIGVIAVVFGIPAVDGIPVVVAVPALLAILLLLPTTSKQYEVHPKSNLQK